MGAACQEHSGERAERESEALERPHDGLPSGRAARVEGGAKHHLRSP
jgi:hypothetical protein